MPKKIVAATIVVVLAIAVFPYAFAFVFLLASSRPIQRDINVRGQVVYRDPSHRGARIVVSIVQDALDGAQEVRYGLIADDQGKFALAMPAPFPFHGIGVEASTVNDDYAMVAFPSSPVTLQMQKLPAALKGLGCVKYATFTGASCIGRRRDMIFLSEPWPVEPGFSQPDPVH